jgi:hypothetical protein
MSYVNTDKDIMSIATKESEDLNLHVQLCAERYNRLEEKFETLETRLEGLHEDFSEFKKTASSNFEDLKGLIAESAAKRFNTMVTTAGTIIVSLLGMMGYLITHLPK